MAAVTICSGFGAPQNKVCHCFHCFPIYLQEMMGLDAMILVFWMLSFNLTFLLSSFTLIKRLFSSFSLSAIRVVSSAYLRLLIFLLAILIPACALSSQAFHMVYSGWQYTALTYYLLNLEPVCCSMSSSNCCFLTCIQVSQEAAQVVFWRIFTGCCDPHNQRLWHS